MSIDFEREIELARRAIRRSPSTIKFYFFRPDKKLSAAQALQIHNEYGINLRDLILLIYSHGFETDEMELINLLNKQAEELKRSVQC